MLYTSISEMNDATNPSAMAALTDAERAAERAAQQERIEAAHRSLLPEGFTCYEDHLHRLVVVRPDGTVAAELPCPISTGDCFSEYWNLSPDTLRALLGRWI